MSRPDPVSRTARSISPDLSHREEVEGLVEAARAAGVEIGLGPPGALAVSRWASTSAASERPVTAVRS